MAARPRKSARPAKGAFAYDGLHRELHEKARLGIMTALVTKPDGILFTELKELCSLTDGNLSRHLQVLQEAKLVEVWKGHDGRRPQTLVRVSRRGRDEFTAYLEELERVIRDAKVAAVARPAPERAGREGFAPA
jgi:DNA-binding transcriptional ArsR family regulator